MKFTIDRSKWICGSPSHNHDPQACHGTGATMLLNHHGFMCCLGFVCEQAGVARDDLLQRSMPASLIGVNAEPIMGLLLERIGLNCEVLVSTDLCKDAIDTNDKVTIYRGEREQMLKDLFSRHGHELEFVGEYTS